MVPKLITLKLAAEDKKMVVRSDIIEGIIPISVHNEQTEEMQDVTHLMLSGDRNYFVQETVQQIRRKLNLTE